MPLHLHYLPSVIPCLDSILEPLIRRHIGFKRRDSFRVFVPDAESRLDLEHRLVEQTELGQVLIGKSFLTLAGFAQLLLPWHPAPLPPASLPMQKKCLQLALNELHPEWRLDSAALQRCLRELHEIDRLRSLRSSRRNSPGLRLLATYENILESRGKSWTLPRLFREAWRLLPQAAAALLPEVTTCYWIGFHLPDENLLGLLETLKRIAPPLELHVFLPSRARVWGTEERLEAWRLRLENLAATLEEEAAGITRPRLEIQAFPTPIHEAEFWTRAWAEAFQQSRILTPSFGEAGERLQAQTAAVLFPQGTADALHGKDSSLIFQLLSVLAEGRDLETLADFCEVLEALQPLFGHLQDLAAKHDDADGLRLLEAYRRRLAEYAQAARLENEKRLWSEWLQELKEEWLQLDLPLALEIAKRLPWRRLDRAGLQQTEEIFIAGMNEGIYPASSPASSSRPDSLSTDFFGEESGYFLERHEADLALEQALYSAKQRAVLSYSNFSVAGRAMLPSSFLGELQEAVVLPLATALTLRLTADQAYFAENVARETRRLRHPEGALDRGGLDSLGLEADILQKLEKHPISAKYIDDYAACPWLFFAGRHLGLKEDIEEDLEIAPTRRGSWLHQILQETLQKFITSHFNNNRFPSIEELEAVLGPILG
ncbi:MAG TPA: hypothetical protein DF383_04650, partial [Deltaproteobacteria bacterium]|nr:hypothetical protein [Deltaproteobacteria bacterium]